MIAGKTFRLLSDVLAIGPPDGKGRRPFTTIPAGSIVTVLLDPKQGDRLLDVRWKARPLMIYIADFEHNAEEVNSAAT